MLANGGRAARGEDISFVSTRRLVDLAAATTPNFKSVTCNKMKYYRSWISHCG
jgi:hypothetical protein